MGLKDKLKEIDELNDDIKTLRKKETLSELDLDYLDKVNSLKQNIDKNKKKLNSLVKKRDLAINKKTGLYEFKTKFSIDMLVSFLSKEFGYESRVNTDSDDAWNMKECKTLSSLLGGRVLESQKLRPEGLSEKEEKVYDDEYRLTVGCKEIHFNALENMFGKITFEEVDSWEDCNDYFGYETYRVYFDGQKKLKLHYEYPQGGGDTIEIYELKK